MKDKQSLSKDVRVLKRYNSGTAVSLKSVLHTVKKRMNQEKDDHLRYAWATVGLELNRLLLKQF